MIQMEGENQHAANSTLDGLDSGYDFEGTVCKIYYIKPKFSTFKLADILNFSQNTSSYSLE